MWTVICEILVFGELQIDVPRTTALFTTRRVVANYFFVNWAEGGISGLDFHQADATYSTVGASLYKLCT